MSVEAELVVVTVVQSALMVAERPMLEGGDICNVEQYG